jgi:hypothetical protein
MACVGVSKARDAMPHMPHMPHHCSQIAQSIDDAAVGVLH